MTDDSGGPGANSTAGWYLDPDMVDTRRYWDGEKWTDHVSPVTPTSTTPPQPRPAPRPLSPLAPAQMPSVAEAAQIRAAEAEAARAERLYKAGRIWAVLIPVVGVIIGIRLLLRDRLRQGVTLILASVLIWGLVAGAVALAVSLTKPTLDHTLLEGQIQTWARNNGGRGITVSCPSGVKIEAGHKFICTLTDRQGEHAHVLVTIENSDGDVSWQLEG